MSNCICSARGCSGCSQCYGCECDQLDKEALWKHIERQNQELTDLHVRFVSLVDVPDPAALMASHAAMLTFLDDVEGLSQHHAEIASLVERARAASTGRTRRWP